MSVSVRLIAALLAAPLWVGSAAGAEPVHPKMRILLLAEPPVRAGAAVPVEIRLLDDAGAPLDAPVALDVDAGKASVPERVASGVYKATVTAPRRLPSSRSILVVARAGVSEVDSSLDLAPGPAATVQLDGPGTCSEELEACPVEVWAVDAEGNPAAEVPSGNADLGRVSAPGWAEPGRWVIVYHAPRVDRERTDRVTVEVGKLRATHELKLTPTRSKIGFAPALGAVRQEGRSGFATGVQVVAQRRLGLGWQIGAGLEGSWWTVSKSGTASGLDVSTDSSQLGVGLLVQAERALAGRLTATLTLGGGAAKVTSTSHVQGQPGVSDTGWAPMLSGALGLGLAYDIGMPYLEIRQAWVGDAHLLTDPGVRWPLFVSVGFRLDVR